LHITKYSLIYAHTAQFIL